ncbi:hypothetical protein K7X08_011009 [Anisodus acutangulus]|uniref:Uncharacterized protein n=1 Tax=Anisodus acutangulus TaxID=402998 RepID=A0A9Q1LZ58_9SOLA|nr:hypothetical protein K7X08_011009 [Anisodus acutangulus]
MLFEDKNKTLYLSMKEGYANAFLIIYKKPSHMAFFQGFTKTQLHQVYGQLAVCCPGLHQAAVLLENSDFGLERELGPDENYPDRVLTRPDNSSQSQPMPSSSSNATEVAADCEPPHVAVSPARVSKRRRIYRSPCSHLASGVWNLSREQGNKLLASRFKGDCLYIRDWSGCIHIEEKRNYMLFRGIMKNFKQSRVWRTINDGNRKKIIETDMGSAFGVLFEEIF